MRCSVIPVLKNGFIAQLKSIRTLAKQSCLTFPAPATIASHRAMAAPRSPQCSTNSHLWVPVLSLCSLCLLGLLYNGTVVSVPAQPFQWGLILE